MGGTTSSHLVSFFKTVCKEVMCNVLGSQYRTFSYEKGYEVFESRLGKRIVDFLRSNNMNKKTMCKHLRKDNRFVFGGDELLSLETGNFLLDEVIELLLAACNLILGNAGDHVDVNNSDKYGNTALHFVAAINVENFEKCRTLMQELLNAGADVTKTNNEGCNVLHMCVERLEAKIDEDGQVWFEYINYPGDFYGPRKLEVCLDNLSQRENETNLAMLLNQPGRNGNTVLHGCVVSASLDVYHYRDAQVNKLKDVLDKGASLKIVNDLGLFPIHFAFRPEVLKCLIEQGGSLRSRSYQGETPLLYQMRKVLRAIYTSNNPPPDSIVDDINNVFGDDVFSRFTGYPKGYTKTASSNRSSNFLHLGTIWGRFGPKLPEISEIVMVRWLEELIDVVKMKEVKETVLIKDDNGISPLEVLLTAVRKATYKFNSSLSLYPDSVNKLANPFVFGHLLKALVDVPHRSEMPQKRSLRLVQQRSHKQSVLHILLDMKMALNEARLRSKRFRPFLQYLTLLLKYGADINAVDQEGQTAMHLLCRQYPACPSLFGQCIAVLMEHHPQLDIKDNTGLTVHDLTSIHVDLQKLGLKPFRKVQCDATNHLERAYAIPNTPSDEVKLIGDHRYSNDSFINSGSFGNVYVSIKDEFSDKESNVITCKAYALKRIENVKVDLKVIKREVELLVKLSGKCNDHIVRYYEVILTTDFYYIVLELMDGDLNWLMQKSQACQLLEKNSQETAQAALQMLKGLAFLHDHEFIHRDLSPANILVLLSPTLVFKIADFGLAKNLLASCPTRSRGTLLGTRCWMAPELLSRESTRHTKESDMFALGLVLHYLLSLGINPAGDDSLPEHEILMKIVKMEISLEEDVSCEGKHLLTTMLVKNPEERGTASELQQHVFFWSEKKKMEFLEAVGNEDEAARPNKHPNSTFEKCLQNTDFGKTLVSGIPGSHWDAKVPDMYNEMVKKKSTYRVNGVLDLLRFIRNAYAHKEERSAAVKTKLEQNVFLKEFPTLLLDVYLAMKNNGFLTSRNGIKEVLEKQYK